jgi:low affinity Fe/Cu permease
LDVFALVLRDVADYWAMFAFFYVIIFSWWIVVPKLQNREPQWDDMWKGIIIGGIAIILFFVIMEWAMKLG